MWAISTLLFLVAGKAGRVPVNHWITSETFHDVQNANGRCTGHTTMSTEHGNDRLITVHVPFLAVTPNQKSLSICCMEALSHWSEIHNSGRCSPWNFTRKYCTYRCHTLRVYRPPKVPHRPLSRTFLRISQLFNFVFFSSPRKQTRTICNNRPNIVDRATAICTSFKVSEVIQRSRRNNK